jgi:predicted dehydrogenase
MLNIGLVDVGGGSPDHWHAAADRLPDVAIVATDSAEAVLVAGIDAANQAAAAGRHVLLQPGSLDSSADAARLVSPQGTVIMLAATGRFRPSIQEVQVVNSDGSLGPLGLLRIHCWGPGGERVGLTSLADQLDLANWLFGSLPGEVYAVRRGASGNYAHVHLGFPGDGMALVDVATTLPGGEDYYSLSLIGGDGSVYADDHHNMHLLYAGGQPEAVRGGEGVAGLVNLLAEFSAAVAEGRAANPGPDAVVDALRVAEAAERSIEAGVPLRLNAAGDAYEPG